MERIAVRRIDSSRGVPLLFLMACAISLSLVVPAFGAGPTTTIPAKKAGSYIGRMLRVRGRVFDVARNRKAIFINFGKDWRRDFTAVIFKDNFKDFDDAGIDPMNYKGRTLVVSGVVQRYKGRAEIIVMRPAQIKAE